MRSEDFWPDYVICPLRRGSRSGRRLSYQHPGQVPYSLISSASVEMAAGLSDAIGRWQMLSSEKIS